MHNEPATPSGPLILVVDDDPTTRLLMSASLKKAGFRVETSENGLQAVNEFEKLKPDAILLDVVMPKLDGYDTCRAIRKQPGGSNLPILMITGCDDVESIHRSFDSGATDFITKPINWTILNYRVKYMLRASEAFYDVIDKQQQIQELAFFDHLTGLANRIMFRDNLENVLAECAETETLVGVLFMDLDRFKNINDTLGHQSGDVLLKNVAERLNSCVRESDLFSRITKKSPRNYVSRLGGDEFTLMLPLLKDPEDAGLVARRINEALNEPFMIGDHEVFISASIGISLFPLDGRDAEELIKYADLAMYYAKEQGKNCYQYYKSSLNIKAQERLEFENDLRKAVANEEFELYFQPQVDLQTGAVTGAEALTRWFHDKRGAVSPGEFIPAIEELGLIVPFTNWVIRSTISQQAEWCKSGAKPVRIAINISSKHFTRQQVPEKIANELMTHQLPGDFLEIELTESVLARQDHETKNILGKLKDVGIAISVDDFGTGYSSLTYLKVFPIDVVKIDRFFINDILTSRRDTAIIKAIIAMAHSMEIKVVAEGIEKQEQCDLLKQIGCDFGQGFLFSPAIPAVEFARHLKK